MMAAAETTYQGQTHYFYSRECKDSFDKERSKYANKRREPEKRS